MLNKLIDDDKFYLVIKENMGLCIEEECFNMKVDDDDFCNECIYDAQTVDSEEFIKNENLIIDIILNNYTLDYNIYMYLYNYCYYKSIYKMYKICIINISDLYKYSYKKIKKAKDKDKKKIQKKIQKKNKQKPVLPIKYKFDKVDYIDNKLQVWEFPMDISEYNHIYNKKILYYKHVCNSNKNKEERLKEPYKAYVCYLENGKKKYESISFTILYKILIMKYNGESISNHIYDITYNQINIHKLINN